MTIFGREPALFAKLSAVLIMLLSTTFTHWSGETQGIVNAAVLAVAGFVVAWKVAHEKALGMLSGVAGALLSLAGAFDWHLTAEQNTAVMSAISVAVAFWLRGQVSAPIDVYGNKVPDANQDHVADA